MGWENVFHCEWNEFGQKVLKHYWPKAISYEDITKTDFTIHRGNIDILTGGFPCQPYSSAGKRLGKEDERHLWPEMLRAIREIAPRWIVGENVRGLTNWNGGMVFEEVCADLENLGYQVTAFLIPACATNAPHKRERIWIVANTGCNGNTTRQRVQRKRRVDMDWIILEKQKRKEKTNRFVFYNNDVDAGNWHKFPSVPPLCNGDDGFSDRLDSITFSKWRNESIKAGGNAVVPQVVFQIFKAIEQYDNDVRQDRQ